MKWSFLNHWIFLNPSGQTNARNLKKEQAGHGRLSIARAPPQGQLQRKSWNSAIVRSVPRNDPEMAAGQISSFKVALMLHNHGCYVTHLRCMGAFAILKVCLCSVFLYQLWDSWPKKIVECTTQCSGWGSVFTIAGKTSGRGQITQQFIASTGHRGLPPCYGWSAASPFNDGSLHLAYVCICMYTYVDNVFMHMFIWSYNMNHICSILMFMQLYLT